MSEEKNGLVNFVRRPPIDIEFQDLSFSVPNGRKQRKTLLRSVSGLFKSGQLTAILGASGAGKSTLLNVLAGYKSQEATGTILINGQPRNIKEFRRISRYIMQNCVVQPMLTVEESMMMAANLKLSVNTTLEIKKKTIEYILDTLRLSHTDKTYTQKLSGGEKKRLCIALELINNPPVIFLDEPTTGLDDLSCSQCVILLKKIAEGGRTVICSIHTPSARLFAIFDNTYILANGQCVYQGYGPSVVQYLSSTINLNCPTHYNPADFILDTTCDAYGDFNDKLITAIDNGRNRFDDGQIVLISDSISNKKSSTKDIEYFEYCDEQRPSTWNQFQVLALRMWLQMWRDKSYLILRIIVYILIGILVGNLYLGFGQDGSKTIFNFGFYFTCTIFFMYMPMMPQLLAFPTEIQYLKREYFNKWYSLPSYFIALTAITFPTQMVLGALYLSMVYCLTDQPLIWERLLMFYVICMLTSFIADSFALMISSNSSLVNAIFLGPVISAPLVMLSIYGIGESYSQIPILIQIMMHFSYMRFAIEGLTMTMLANRGSLPCPEEEEFCILTNLERFIELMGMDNAVLWIDILALVLFLILFRSVTYYLIRQRLAPNKTFLAIHYVGNLIKSYVR